MTGCLFFAAQSTLHRGIEERTKFTFLSQIDITFPLKNTLLNTGIYIYTLYHNDLSTL